MSQQHYYPAASIANICQTCYSGQSSSCQPENGSSQNSTPCGSCNTVCNSSQAYCNINHQFVTSHEDVGTFSGFNVQKDDFIHEKWTKTKWTELQNLYINANSVGNSVSQGASLSFTNVQNINLITAALYNEFHNAATAFNNSSATPLVNQNDLITAALSTALETGLWRKI